MKTKLFFVVGLVTVFFISTPAPCQQEEITLSTYYPAPYGEYDELCAEKLLVDTPSAAELQDMARGDCHITNSLIVGSGIGTGFSYDELEGIGSLPANGDVLIMNNVGIGTTNPISALHLYDPAWDTDVYIGNPPQSVHGHVSPEASGIFVASDTNYGPAGGFGGHVFFINKETGKTWHVGVANNDSLRITETAVATSINCSPGGNVGIGTAAPTRRLEVAGSIGLTAGGIAGIGTTDNFDLRLSTNGVDRVAITTTGNVGIGTTDPQAKLQVDGGIVTFTNQSRARAYRSSTPQSIPNNQWTKVQLNAETYDSQNEFDSTTNYRFAATKAGYYLVIGNTFLQSGSATAYINAAIYKNGIWYAISRAKGTDGAWTGIMVSDVVYLAVNDYVEFYVYQNTGAAINLTDNSGAPLTYFTIHKIS